MLSNEDKWGTKLYICSTKNKPVLHDLTTKPPGEEVQLLALCSLIQAGKWHAVSEKGNENNNRKK